MPHQTKNLRRQLEAEIAVETQDWFVDDDDYWSEDQGYDQDNDTNRVAKQAPSLTINIQNLLATNHNKRVSTKTGTPASNCSVSNSDDIIKANVDDKPLTTNENKSVESVHKRYDELARVTSEPKVFLTRSRSLAEVPPSATEEIFQIDNGLLPSAPLQQVELSRCPSQLFPLISITQFLVPTPAIVAAVGPSLRASLVISTPSKRDRALVVLAWCMSHQASAPGVELRAIPIAGCGKSAEASWMAALAFEQNVKEYLQEFWIGDKAASVYQRYLKLCDFMVARTSIWGRLLNRSVTFETRHSQPFHIPKAFDRLAKPLEASLDRFDVLLEYLYEQPPTQQLESKVGDDKLAINNEDNSGLCLVCFEAIHDDPWDVSMLMSCGHRTCSTCWRDYLKSAAASGQGHVRCPAYKCSIQLGLFDAAHILFVQPRETCNEKPDTAIDDATLFDKLVRFELEGFATTQLHAQHCPGPRCTRFVRGSKLAPGLGWTISQCPCGMSRCTECNGPSHPAVACTAYKKMREAVDSNRVDSELANVKWVLKNSRPCPKCRFPIQKDGGCNHVRCEKCNDYFCWECGGPGQHCMAYHCLKAKEERINVEAQSDEEELFRLLSEYKRIRQIEFRLKQLITANATLSEGGNSDVYHLSCMEVSLNQVLLWCDIYLCVKLMENINAAPDEVMIDRRNNLELVLHALNLRNHNMAEQRSGSGKQEKSTTNMSLPCNNQKKYVSKRKQQALHQRQDESEGNLDFFKGALADRELQDLCTATPGEFNRMAQKAMQAAIRWLWEISGQRKPVTSGYRRQGRKTKCKVDDVVLNPKLTRSRAPWKNGMRPFPEAVDPEQEQEPARKQNRWRKGRARVKQMRDHNVSRHLDGLL